MGELAAMLLKTDFGLMDDDDGSAQITELHERHQEREKALQAMRSQLDARGIAGVERRKPAVSQSQLAAAYTPPPAEEEDEEPSQIVEELTQVGDRFVGQIRQYNETTG